VHRLKALGLAALLTAISAAPTLADDVVGSATATFVNPQPGGVVTGVGTNAFTYGDPGGFGTGPNSLTFAGVGFSSAFETPFKVGTLTYFNGTTG